MIILKRSNLKNIPLNKMTREEFKSFFQRNKYKRSYFQYIGCGQFRTVYKFRYNNEFYVLKLARSKEDIHCDNEKWAYIETRNTRAADILCEVLTDYSDDMITVMRYAKPFVQKYYGGDKDIIPQYKVNYIKYKYDFDNYRVPFNNIYDACRKTGTDFNDFVDKIACLAEQGIGIEDLYLANLGTVKGKLVIIDYGMEV